MNELLKFLQSASNSVAGNVAGPVDLINMGLGKIGLPVSQSPLGGSEWMRACCQSLSVTECRLNDPYPY